MNVAAPVYAGHDLILANTATIAETIPASLTLPARPNRIAVGHDLYAREPAEPGRPRQRISRSGQRPRRDPRREPCSSKNNPTSTRRAPGGTPTRSGASSTTTSSRPASSRLPTLTCCSPIGWAAPADGTSHPASAPFPSYMGFWYLNAGLGPNSPCATCSGTPPKFDTASGADNTINESAYRQAAPFDLTGANYSCTSADGQTKLAWDGTTLTIQGTVFIDGSAKSTAGRREVRRQGDDHPQRALLDGQQHRAVREPLGQRPAARARRGMRTPPPSRSSRTGSTRPCGRCRATASKSRKGTSRGCCSPPGTSSASVSGTLVIGPMVSVYGSVDAGQSGTLQFPPITFASSGTDGLTGPLPLPRLLPPHPVRRRLTEPCRRGISKALLECRGRPRRQRRPPQARSAADRPLRRRARAARRLAGTRSGRAGGGARTRRRLVAVAASPPSRRPASSTPPTRPTACRASA